MVKKRRLWVGLFLPRTWKFPWICQWYGKNRRLTVGLFQPCTWKFPWIYQQYCSVLYLYLNFYWAGFTVAQRERAQEDFNVPYEGAPPHPPHICIRKTATAPGSPYSFRIVRGFFYVPQNYQHSRNCETASPAYRPYPRRLESLTICIWNYKGSTFSSVI